MLRVLTDLPLVPKVPLGSPFREAPLRSDRVRRRAAGRPGEAELPRTCVPKQSSGTREGTVRCLRRSGGNIAGDHEDSKESPRKCNLRLHPTCSVLSAIFARRSWTQRPNLKSQRFLTAIGGSSRVTKGSTCSSSVPFNSASWSEINPESFCATSFGAGPRLACSPSAERTVRTIRKSSKHFASAAKNSDGFRSTPLAVCQCPACTCWRIPARTV